MLNYSEVIVFFLMVPVLMQIILPLLMLVGYGLGQMVKALFKPHKSDPASVGDVHLTGKMATNI